MIALHDFPFVVFRTLVVTIVVTQLAGATASEECKSEIPRPFEVENQLTCPQLTNLELNPEHYPWTHVPQCLETPDEGKGLPETFCLYTRAIPEARREFSIVTTRELAETIALKDAISKQNQDIERISLEAEESSYETRDTKSRGVATFAKERNRSGAGDIY